MQAQWYKDKQEVFPGRKFTANVEGDKYTLVVKKPTVDDGGVYTIKINKKESIAYFSVEGEKVVNILLPFRKLIYFIGHPTLFLELKP